MESGFSPARVSRITVYAVDQRQNYIDSRRRLRVPARYSLAASSNFGNALREIVRRKPSSRLSGEFRKKTSFAGQLDLAADCSGDADQHHRAARNPAPNP